MPDKVGELYQKLQGVEYDSNKKTRIRRFLHTYSHFDQIAQPEHDLSVLAETPAILRKVLDLIRHCDPGHFTSMTALATQQTDEYLMLARPAMPHRQGIAFVVTSVAAIASRVVVSPYR
ncbi:hypothetical protein [Paraburkholderia sp. RL17-337-BIB-A]|uniref:hypothetical protein n=1 Tax=Paraburkholderia sp. RL17-337-BIB-A TaxID=3031636 RepID=UPI0038BB32F5